MLISILTLFPDFFQPFLYSSIIGRAKRKKQVKFRVINIRDFALDKHKTVDDKPYGGGIGMLLRVDIVEKAITHAVKKARTPVNKTRIILMDPAGSAFVQSTARRLTIYQHLILICGHYEGIDARIYHYIDESISIGPYILTGGETPSMVVADAVIRLLPGVLRQKEATREESYSDGKSLEFLQYTRPPVYKSHHVPKILLSGNHKKIEEWKRRQSVRRTSLQHNDTSLK